MNNESEETTYIQKEQLVQNVSKLQEQYYEHNPKRLLFKSKQKYECAKQVVQNGDVQKLIQHSFFLIPNTNCIFFDYPLFKTFACTDIYDEYTTHSYNVIYDCISRFSTFEMHVNLNSFTISAFERLRKLMERFFGESPLFSDKLKRVYVYYTPSVIEQINIMIRICVGHIFDKIVYFTKVESEQKLNALFSGNYTGHFLEPSSNR